MHKPYPDRHSLLDRIVHMQRNGWRQADIAALPGMPSRPTIWRWSRSHPTWTAQIKEAHGEGGFLRRQSRRGGGGDGFDAETAQGFVNAVRRGHRIADLTRAPEWPSAKRLLAWKRAHPEFRASLRAAVGVARRVRLPWPYEEAVADRVILRLMRGEPLRRLLRDPALPGLKALRRWRREVEGFDGAVRMALRQGARVRAWDGSACTPELTERIEEAVAFGATLGGLSSQDGFPHRNTLYGWRRTRPDFAEAMARADRFHADLMLDEALELAEAVTPQTMAATKRRIDRIHARLDRLRREQDEA